MSTFSCTLCRANKSLVIERPRWLTRKVYVRRAAKFHRFGCSVRVNGLTEKKIQWRVFKEPRQIQISESWRLRSRVRFSPPPPRMNFNFPWKRNDLDVQRAIRWFRTSRSRKLDRVLVARDRSVLGAETNWVTRGYKFRILEFCLAIPVPLARRLPPTLPVQWKESSTRATCLDLLQCLSIQK